MTPKNSSFDSASRVKFASGSETSGLKHIESNALISPRVDRVHDLLRGVARLRKFVREMPQTPATCSRAVGIDESIAGPAVDRISARARARPVRCPGR